MSTSAPVDTQETNEPSYARVTQSYYPVILAVFCSLLIISNIGAVKLIEFGPIITDGGAFLFPLVYIAGDVLAEVYGFKAARKAIFLGFAMSVLAALTFLLVQVSPPAADWPNQEAFESVLGFVPRIVLASLCAFLVGQLINSYILVKIKARTKEKGLWARLLGSSIVGQIADTIVFCTIAFYGIITGHEFMVYVVFGFVYKVAVEVIFLPVTYAVIRYIKRNESSYGPVTPAVNAEIN